MPYSHIPLKPNNCAACTITSGKHGPAAPPLLQHQAQFFLRAVTPHRKGGLIARAHALDDGAQLGNGANLLAGHIQNDVQGLEASLFSGAAFVQADYPHARGLWQTDCRCDWPADVI